MSPHVKQNPKNPPGTLGLSDEMKLWASLWRGSINVLFSYGHFYLKMMKSSEN